MNDSLKAMREVFLIVGDLRDSGAIFDLREDYGQRLYAAFDKAQETPLGQQWEAEARGESAVLLDIIHGGME